jgi:hypothetical protein
MSVRRSFVREALTGLVLSALGAALAASLTLLGGPVTASKLAIAAMSLGYTTFCLARIRSGRILAAVIWLTAAIAAWLSPLSLAAYGAAHVGLLWLIRASCTYSSLLSAVADLGLSLLGVVLAAWAWVRTGSPFLAGWCFFLTLAMHAWIPDSVAARNRQSPGADDARDRFEEAHRAAQAALARLASKY